jgi:hypothetical protein
MSLIVKDGDSLPREKPEIGMHDAVCVFVVDVGTHTVKTQWGDKNQHKIVICFELDQKLTGGKFAGFPFMVSKRYTFTLFEKGNLSHDLESWFAKKMSDEVRKNGFDLDTLKGRHCTLNLIESEDGKYINIGAVLPASKTNMLTQVCMDVPEWITKLAAMSLEKTSDNSFDSGEQLPDASNAPIEDSSDGLPF